ncbi:MAG: monovalent cation/H(+) antiporter subunit G [Proteobacteria bacterium]|nr:monovalent cation/H(+) antiporter subunit G [Pseudomonadota bacterium]MDA1023140.1 monovalent cation/H(+) antiporter subunit G [Pseudomonadota bacterium]
MDVVLEIISFALMGLGAIMLVIGGVGIIRLNDVFSRMHAVGIIDTLGAGAVLAGLMIQAGLGIVTIKLMLIVVFILFTSPTATHALARAALNGGVRPQLDEGAAGESGEGEES